MAQTASAFTHRGELSHIIPKASSDLHSGDYVVMPRNVQPISRAVLGAEARISAVATGWAAQWGVGIVDSDFSTNTVGAAKYATPTDSEALPVIRRGVIRLAINKTSGKAGDMVIFSSGASGAQVFTLNNGRRDIAVGELEKDYSGASSGDLQSVRLFEKSLSAPDIYYFMSNRVMGGCVMKQHSVANQMSSQLMAGATGDVNQVMIKGKAYEIARLTDFTIGALNPGASDIRFFWVAAKVSTTGGAPKFFKVTCTGPMTAIASFTNSVVSAGLMIPLTWTSNQIPVALLIGFSATQITVKANRIMNVGGWPAVPNGISKGNHTKWYL